MAIWLLNWLLGRTANRLASEASRALSGTDFERAFAEALDEAIDAAAGQLTRNRPHVAEETAAVLRFVLTEEPSREQAIQLPVLTELPEGRLSSAIAEALGARLRSLGDQDLTEVGSSSAELLGFDALEAANLPTDVFAAVICRRAALGTLALAPLADQLNFELAAALSPSERTFREARSGIRSNKLAIRLDRGALSQLARIRQVTAAHQRRCPVDITDIPATSHSGIGDARSRKVRRVPGSRG